MAVYKKTQIAGIGLVILIILGAGVWFLRPDLVPLDSFSQGIEAIKGYIPGQKAVLVDPGASSAGNKAAAGGVPAVLKKNVYLIELKSGGRVITDNLKMGDGKLTYQTDKGLEVTIGSHEVTAVRKIKEGEEPDR